LGRFNGFWGGVSRAVGWSASSGGINFPGRI